MSNQPPPPPPGGPSSRPPPLPPGGGEPVGDGGFNAERMANAVRTADRQDLALVGAGILALIFSVVPLWYSASYRGSTTHTDAWHGFFSWFGVLLALVAGVVVALIVLKILPQLPVSAYLVATVAFGLATVFLLVALFTSPYVGQLQDLCDQVGRSCSRSDLENLGFGFGTGPFLWLTIVLTLVATGLSGYRFIKTR